LFYLPLTAGFYTQLSVIMATKTTKIKIMKRGGQFAPKNTEFFTPLGGGQFGLDKSGHIDRILQ
jgi:hypothetical protein